MKSALNLLLALIPPTFAADKITNFGLLTCKNLFTFFDQKDQVVFCHELKYS